MGHWATVCTSVVVGHQFISERIAEPRTEKKKKILSDLTNWKKPALESGYSDQLFL